MKGDLKDVSFIMPVRIDSECRVKSLVFVVSYLLDRFDTTVMIYEEDVESKLPSLIPPDLLSRIKYRFFKSEDADKCFRRSKLFNEMIIDSTTTIIAPHDVDVFLMPEENYILAANAIRNNESKVVIPHNSCKRCDVASEEFYADPKIEFLKHNRTTHNNLGGFVMFDKESLIDGGMWNEGFEIWGQDDEEIMKRMLKLGYPAKRLKFALYHLDHPKTMNVGFYAGKFQHKNPLLGVTHKATPEELREMVNNWSWVKRARHA